MTLLRNIPKGIIKVDNPDHPFTFDGPDSLLSDKKGLLAIFRIRDNEQKNTSKLFARLINALIAYPASTKMLFLHDYQKEIPNVVTQFWKYYFSDFIELNDIKKSRSIMNDKKREKQIKEIQTIQKRIFALQSQIQRNNLEYIKKVNFKATALINPRQLKEKAMYTNKLTNREVIARANIFSYKDYIIGIKKLSKSAPDLIELQPYYEFVINSEFNVDNGVPYYSHLKRKVLNLSDVPRIRYDPMKPMRIASLFGWLISNSSDLQQIENRIPNQRK